MTVDPKAFLDALVVFMATTSELTQSSPRILWANEANQKQSADPYSVLRIYDGSLPQNVPVVNIAIQCMTVGKIAAAAYEQASQLYQTLVDDQGRPLTMTVIGESPQYRINGLTLKPPGFVGIDEERRSMVSFNFAPDVVQLA